MPVYSPTEPKQAHPLPLGFAMAALVSGLHAFLNAVGVPGRHDLGFYAVVALLAGATLALTGYERSGYGIRPLFAFTTTAWLGSIELWWG